MKRFCISAIFAFLICLSFSSCADIITADTVASYVDTKGHFKILFHDDGSYEFNPISGKAPSFLYFGYYEGDPRVDGTIERYVWNILKEKSYQEPFEVKDGKFTTVIKEQDYVFVRKYARKDE